MEKMSKDKLKLHSLKLKDLILSQQIEKKTKKAMFRKGIKFFIFYTLLFGVLAACQQNKADKKEVKEKKQQYTCSMHPQIIEDHPGSCPICGMDLVPLQHKNIDLQVDAGLAELIQPTNKVVISNINTIHPQEFTSSDTVLMNGKIGYDTERIFTQSAQYGGRIEKLYVRYNFQKIRKGQKLMEIYSPDLAAAQQQLLYVKSQQDDHLLQLAKSRLRLLGVSDIEINRTLNTGSVNYKIPVYSKYSGYVIDPEMEKSISDRNASGMDANPRAISLLEGDYIKTGDALYKIFNNQKLWAIVYADADQIKHLKVNQAVEIMGEKDTTVSKIDLLQPYFNQQQPYGLVRIVIDNTSNQYKIGELIKARVISKPLNGLWIPEEASYQLGDRTIVFIKKNQVLMAKEIIVGIKSGDFIQVKNGLEASDNIAANAAFLMDSESFIQTQNK